MKKQALKNILVFQHDAMLYGASQSLLAVLEHLVKSRDLQVFVLLPARGMLEDRLSDIGVSYRVIPFPRCITIQGISVKMRMRRVMRYLRDENNMLPKLVDLASEFKPDLIYTNTSAVSIGFKLSRLLGIPHVWHIREFGDIDFQYLPHRVAVKRRILRSERVIFASRALKSHWVKSDAAKFMVVYNGVPSVKKTLSKEKPAGRKWRFGIIGPLIPKKGQDVALHAFLTLIQSYPDCELHLFGGREDIHFASELEIEIKQNDGQEKVFFHNFVVASRSIYDGLDVVLCCSVNEAFGRTLIEAMSRGIPVIANARGGPVEIIEDGRSGLLYNKTPEDLLQKIELLMSDDQLYHVISEQAISISQRKFSVEEYVGSVERILMEAGTTVRRL